MIPTIKLLLLSIRQIGLVNVSFIKYCQTIAQSKISTIQYTQPLDNMTKQSHHMSSHDDDVLQ